MRLIYTFVNTQTTLPCDNAPGTPLGSSTLFCQAHVGPVRVLYGSCGMHSVACKIYLKADLSRVSRKLRPRKLRPQTTKTQTTKTQTSKTQTTKTQTSKTQTSKTQTTKTQTTNTQTTKTQTSKTQTSKTQTLFKTLKYNKIINIFLFTCSTGSFQNCGG